MKRAVFPVPAALVLLVMGAKPSVPPAAPRPDDPLTINLQTALDLHKAGDTASAMKRIWQAVDDARARLPLDVHTGLVLEGVPENLGIYRTAHGSMVFDNVVMLYLEVDNHGLRKRPEGYELDMWTDVFILYDDGQRIGGKEHFGRHNLIARVPYRTTHMVLEVNVKSLPAQAYQAQVVVHDAVSGKTGEVFIPFRIAARPRH